MDNDKVCMTSDVEDTIYSNDGIHLFRFLSDEGPMLETLDYTIRIGSTPTFLYFDLCLYSAYAAHYVYFIYLCLLSIKNTWCDFDTERTWNISFFYWIKNKIEKFLTCRYIFKNVKYFS